MKKELDLVKTFHKKFQALVSEHPSLIPRDRFELRYNLMEEEIEEYRAGAEKGDIENIAKELCDILYAVYGTIVEHGLQEKIEAIFEEVHTSNMSKDYHQYKMIKGENYQKPNVHKYFEKDHGQEKRTA